MRMRRTGPSAVAIACLLLAGAAFAEDDDDYSREGYYLSAGGNWSKEFLDPSGLSQYIAVAAVNPTVPISAEDSWGINVRAGRRINDWFAAEFQYEWMNRFDFSQDSGTSVAGTGQRPLGRYDPDTVTLNAKVFLPFWRAQPYVIAGMGIVSYDFRLYSPIDTFQQSETAFAFRAGGGADVYVTNHIFLTAEATYVINTDGLVTTTLTNGVDFTLIDDLNYVTVTAGIGYRF